MLVLYPQAFIFFFQAGESGRALGMRLDSCMVHNANRFMCPDM